MPVRNACETCTDFGKVQMPVLQQSLLEVRASFETRKIAFVLPYFILCIRDRDALVLGGVAVC